jgi:L-fucose isomerase-like protein
MNDKPKIGVLAIAKKNQHQGDVRNFLEYYQKRLAGDPSIAAYVADRLLFDETEILAAIKELELAGVNLIVFVVGTWIYSSLIISAVNDLKTPFVLYGLSDQIANGNLGAAVQIKYVLQEMKQSFLFLSGPVHDEANFRTLLCYLKAAWVKHFLRNRKIGIIGGKCMMMYQTQVNEFNWKSVFGVDFPQYDTVQVLTEMANIDDQEAKPIAQEFLSKCNKVHWSLDTGETILDDAILSQAKMFLAFKRMQALYGVDIFANKCMPELVSGKYGYGYGACVATCMLNEAGIVTACEADVPAALSMDILALISGAKVFFADIARLNKLKKIITFYNCGTAPISMADHQKGISLWPIPANIADEAVPYEYYTNSMKGACIHFDLEENREITLFRIGGNDETLRFHVATAKTAGREVGPDEIQGTRWPGFGAEFSGDPNQFLENTTGHHYSIAYGNWVEELRYLAQILRIKFVLDG